MSKIASILGSEKKLKDIRIKKFELGGHTFRVRVPLVAESDQIYAKVVNPDQEKIDNIYKQLTASLIQFKDKESEDFVFTDDDISVNGRSMKEAAKNKAMIESWALSERTYESNKTFYSYGTSFDPIGSMQTDPNLYHQDNPAKYHERHRPTRRQEAQ